MTFLLGALVIGLVIGRLTGGRFANLAHADLRLVSVLLVGVGLQVGSALLTAGPAVVAVVASYGFLLAFALANLRFVGMALVALGVAMNAVVIAVNGGMPVRAESAVAAGIVERGDELASVDLGAKRHLASPDDRLVVLGDIIPVRLTREVLSFGDLVLAVGVADVMVHLLRRRERPIPAVLRETAGQSVEDRSPSGAAT